MENGICLEILLLVFISTSTFQIGYILSLTKYFCLQVYISPPPILEKLRYQQSGFSIIVVCHKGSKKPKMDCLLRISRSRLAISVFNR